MYVHLPVFSEFLSDKGREFRNGLEDVDVRIIASNYLRAPATRVASHIKHDGVWAKRIVDAECRVALISHPPHDGSCVDEPLHHLLVSHSGIQNVLPLPLTVWIVAPPIEGVVSKRWERRTQLT